MDSSCPVVSHTSSSAFDVTPEQSEELATSQMDKKIQHSDWQNECAEFLPHVLKDRDRASGGQSKFLPSLASETSSMAVSVSDTGSTSAPSSIPPSLGSYSSFQDSSSVRTSRASVIQQNALDEGESGALRQRALQDKGKLRCPFNFLNCTYQSDHIGQWKTHSQSHFRGHLPKRIDCPFGCKWRFQADSGEEAWRQFSIHCDVDHDLEGPMKSDGPPSAYLIDHLWLHRLIDDAQRIALLRHGTLAAEYNFTTSERRVGSTYRPTSRLRAWWSSTSAGAQRPKIHQEFYPDRVRIDRSSKTYHAIVSSEGPIPEMRRNRNTSQHAARNRSLNASENILTRNKHGELSDYPHQMSSSRIRNLSARGRSLDSKNSDSGYGSMASSEQGSEYQFPSIEEISQKFPRSDSSLVQTLADLQSRMDTLLARTKHLSTRSDLASIPPPNQVSTSSLSLGLTLRRSYSCPRTGREPQSSGHLEDYRRTHSQPPCQSHHGGPQITVFGPHGRCSGSNSNGKTQSLGQKSHSFRKWHCGKHPGRRDEDAGSPSGRGNGNSPPGGDPSSPHPNAGTKRFPCLNAVGEPTNSCNCTFAAVYISELMKHMKTHRFYACEKCVEPFGSEQEMESHKNLPHTQTYKCQSTNCRRYRPSEGNYRCSSCLRSAEEQFQALLVLKYPHLGQEPHNAAGTASTSPEYNVSQASTIPQIQHNDPDPFDFSFSGFTAIDGAQPGLDQAACSTTAATPLQTVTMRDLDIDAGFQQADSNDQREAIQQPVPDFNCIIFDLSNKAGILEDRLKFALLQNESLKSALGRVWKRLAQSGDQEALPGSQLYQYVKEVAPSVVANRGVVLHMPSRSPNAPSAKNLNRAQDVTPGFNTWNARTPAKPPAEYSAVQIVDEEAMQWEQQF